MALVAACLTFSTVVVAGTQSGADVNVPFFPTPSALPSLAGGTDQYVASTSCSSAGNCVAVGEAAVRGQIVGLILEERAGSWLTPRSVSYVHGGTTYDTALIGVSCSSDGSCTAIGDYAVASGGSRSTYPITISETNGSWDAEPTAPLTQDPTLTYTMIGVSCWAAGDCVTFGSFQDQSNHQTAFSLTLTNGSWSSVTSMNLPAFYWGGYGSISCPEAGTCTAVGFETANSPLDALILSMVDGVWQAPVSIPAPSGASSTFLFGIDCPSVGNCTAVGAVNQPAPDARVHGSPVNESIDLAVSETSGHWGAPQPLQTATGTWNVLLAVSCVSAGTCTAVGAHDDHPPVDAPVHHGTPQFGAPYGGYASYVTMSGGIWGPVSWLPQTGILGIDVFCSAPAACMLVGYSATANVVSNSEPQLSLAPSTPNAVLHIGYVGRITPLGGVGPYTESVTQGSLPPGLSLDPATGAITGTPQAVGTYTFTVSATDASDPNQQTSVVASVTVEPLLAATGFDPLPLLWTVTLLGGLGLVALFIRRRFSSI